MTCSPTTRSPSSAWTTPPTASGRRGAPLSPATGRRSPTLAPWPGQIGLAKAMRSYDLHRTISFHSRVKRAREFAAEMPEVIALDACPAAPEGCAVVELRVG